MAKKLNKKNLKKTAGGKIIRDKDGNYILVGDDDPRYGNNFYGIENDKKELTKPSGLVKKGK